MGDFSLIMPIAVAITTIGGAWLTIRKIARDTDLSKKEQSAEILQTAKEADSELRLKLESRIQSLELEVKNLEGNVQKDIEHLKEAHNTELKNLGEKIEILRTEVRGQHGQIISLLTEMIKYRD